MAKTAKIENNVIKNLADIVGEKKKAFSDSTVILLFIDNKTKFDKKFNTVYLNRDDTTILITSLEKEYKILLTDINSRDRNVSSFVALIANKLSEAEKVKKIKRAEKKAQKKAAKSVIPTFFFKSEADIFEFEIIEDGRGIHIDTNKVSAGPDFWNKFDKWYSQNRKTLIKKPKKEKKEKNASVEEKQAA